MVWIFLMVYKLEWKYQHQKFAMKTAINLKMALSKTGVEYF
jgi:hypothetical protein